MKILDQIHNAMELVDEVRDRYRFYCSENVDAFGAFVNGFCLARNIDPAPFWEAASICVREFFPVYPSAEPWQDVVRRHSICHRSEISLLYAAIDWHRQTVYLNAWDCTPTQEWRSRYAGEGSRVEGKDGSELSAPHRIVVVETTSGGALLFYLNERGERYFEASLPSVEKLKRWAMSCLGIDIESWAKHASGMFNKALLD